MPLGHRVRRSTRRAGRDLVVVGRAGVGIDNVYIKASSSGRGVIGRGQLGVEHLVGHGARRRPPCSPRPAPQIVSVAGRARGGALGANEVGRAWSCTARRSGSRLGRVGTLVARRGRFGMRLRAYDPYVTPDRSARSASSTRGGASPLRFRERPPAEDTGDSWRDRQGALPKSKPGIRIVNAARGGSSNEDALVDAISMGWSPARPSTCFPPSLHLLALVRPGPGRRHTAS